MRVGIYGRVSTADKGQDPELQLGPLREYALAREWTIYREYVDHGISGAKERRPALDQLMDDAKRRLFDVVVVWRFDRFARSTRHMINALHEFRHLGIAFVSYQENLDTSSPLGEAMFTIIGAMAQLERDITRERVKAGVARARARGKKLGRPQKVFHRDQVEQLRAGGLSFRQIGKRLRISPALALTLSRNEQKDSTSAIDRLS
ncbi:MAG: recombinase family protein [Candidatus Binatia bacterium]